jgi:hypothetical protein
MFCYILSLVDEIHYLNLNLYGTGTHRISDRPIDLTFSRPSADTTGTLKYFNRFQESKLNFEKERSGIGKIIILGPESWDLNSAKC